MTTIGNDCDYGYFYLPLVSMTEALNTSTDLQWQLLGLWILLLISSGKNTDLYLSLATMSGTQDTKADF